MLYAEYDQGAKKEKKKVPLRLTKFEEPVSTVFCIRKGAIRIGHSWAECAEKGEILHGSALLHSSVIKKCVKREKLCNCVQQQVCDNTGVAENQS